MYCPQCGSFNQEGVKFCTRCGANLAVVSDALTGKLASGVILDERVSKLLKDYNRGRRDFITGAILMPAGAVLWSLLILAGLKPIAAFFIICWIFFWGISALASGLGKWLAASGELKLLHQYTPPNATLPAGQAQRLPSVERAEGQYATDPIHFPASVTEHTTRQLEGRAAQREDPEGIG